MNQTQLKTSTLATANPQLLAAALFVVLVGLWELLVRQSGISALVLPAPSAVATTLYA